MPILKKLAVYDLHSIALSILFISFSSFKVLSQANPQQTINLLNELCKNHQWKAEKPQVLRAINLVFQQGLVGREQLGVGSATISLLTQSSCVEPAGHSELR